MELKTRSGRRKEQIMNLTTNALSILAGMTIAGCSISPYHNELFNNTTTPIPFYGCSNASNSPITLEAIPNSAPAGPWSSKPWETISSFHQTSASTVSYTDAHGINWYCYSQNFVIPARYWDGPLSPESNPPYPFQADIRVLDNGYPDYTYLNDSSKSRSQNLLT